MSSVESTEWKSIYNILNLLSQCEFISGEELGESLAISRAGVWKYIKKIEQLGIEIESAKGKGYKLTNPITLLSADTISTGLEFSVQQVITSIDVFPVIPSTNTFLLEQKNVKGRVCLAEMQTAGRGRRGRQWVSPFARNIYLSIGWRFESGIQAVQGLSLAVGVAIIDALNKFKINDVFLKWPNDLVVKSDDPSGYSKLAGILVELRGDAFGDCELIIGVGLNYDMKMEASIDQPWVSLDQLAAVKSVDLPGRNELTSALIGSITHLLLDYEQKTFSHYRARWEELNIHRNRQIRLSLGAEVTEGTFLKLNDEGALILLTHSGKQMAFNGGEISLGSLR